MPSEITLRGLQYPAESPGFRVGAVTVATTLLDAAAYPDDEMAALYFRRRLVEVNKCNNIININKFIYQMTQGVLEELTTFAPPCEPGVIGGDRVGAGPEGP